MRLFGLSLPIDRAGLYALAGRVLSGLSGLVTVALISTTMSAEMQGYFFTFLSVATMQVLLDMGMATVMINFVAHEWSAATGTPGAAADDAASRLASLARFALRWYGAAAIVMFVIFQLVGYGLFGRLHNSAIWPWPWAFLSVFVALDMALLAAWTVLEGCNKVEMVYAYRAIRTAILSLGMCAGVLMGAGLWSVGIGYACTLPVAFFVLRGREGGFLRDVLKTKLGARADWRREMLPMQWQTSLVAMANYAGVWAVTPIALATLGPVPAGQVGMTWTLINAISGIAFAVVIVKAPTYGHLVNQKRYRELDRLALRASGLSMLLSALGCSTLFAITWALDHYKIAYGARLLPPLAVGVLVLSTIIGQSVGPQLTYLRAFKREPFPWVQVTYAALVLTAIVAGGKWFGLYGIVWGYAFAVVGFLVPLTSYSTWRYRRLWMAERV